MTLAAAFGTAAANAQTVSVLTSGLNFPMKLAMTPGGNLLVSEANFQPNTGRISIVDRSGTRRTLLDGLPAGPGFPGNPPLGPSALVLDGRTLYVGILEGDTLAAGATPASPPVPNPNGPSSPIFSSILKIQFGADVDRLLTGFALTLDDHFTLADGWEVKLANSDGQTATAGLLAGFPSLPLDRREIYGHVTPYGMTLDAGRQFLYVADAGQNRIIKVDAGTGRWQTLVRFPRIPRVPQTATATETDAVPTSVRFFGEDLLVTFLTGEPFAEGAAEVRIVNTVTREVRPFIGGLTTATDVLYRDSRPGSQFFVSEFRSVLVGAPRSGRVLQYDSPAGRVVADGLFGPTGMVQDPASGDVFVTEYFLGRIIQIKLP